MRDVFVSQLQLIQQTQPKALQLFCESYITFGQALKFSTARHRFNGLRLHDLKVRNKKHRANILARLPGHVRFPTASISSILDELELASPEIAEAVKQGKLTLLESRALRNKVFTDWDLSTFLTRNATDARFVTPKRNPVPSPRDRLLFRRTPVLRFGTR